MEIKTPSHNLLYKNIFLRILVFLPFLVIGNCPFFVIWNEFDPQWWQFFNVLMVSILIVVNLLDLLLMRFLKNRKNKFARWIFINKFIPWDTSQTVIYLPVSQQNKFLVRNKSYFSLPLLSPIVELPLWFIFLLVTSVVVGVVSILMLDLPIIYSGIITLTLSPLCLIFVNLNFKNLNDFWRINHNHFQAISREIEAMIIENDPKISEHETWTFGYGRIVLSFISLVLFILSLLGLTVASFNLFDGIDAFLLGDVIYGTFNEWRILIFNLDPIANAIIVGIFSLLFLSWSISLWSFVHLPWYLFIFWKRNYLIFNFMTFNFITIFFWSLRFTDEKKNFIPIVTLNLNAIGQKSPTKTKTIVVKKTPIFEKEKEQIITRVVPLSDDED